jgi:hypothetical protein
VTAARDAFGCDNQAGRHVVTGQRDRTGGRNRTVPVCVPARPPGGSQRGLWTGGPAVLAQPRAVLTGPGTSITITSAGVSPSSVARRADRGAPLIDALPGMPEGVGAVARGSAREAPGLGIVVIGQIPSSATQAERASRRVGNLGRTIDKPAGRKMRQRRAKCEDDAEERGIIRNASRSRLRLRALNSNADPAVVPPEDQIPVRRRNRHHPRDLGTAAAPHSLDIGRIGRPALDLQAHLSQPLPRQATGVTTTAGKILPASYG